MMVKCLVMDGRHERYCLEVGSYPKFYKKDGLSSYLFRSHPI